MRAPRVWLLQQWIHLWNCVINCPRRECRFITSGARGHKQLHNCKCLRCSLNCLVSHNWATWIMRAHLVVVSAHTARGVWLYKSTASVCVCVWDIQFIWRKKLSQTYFTAPCWLCLSLCFSLFNYEEINFIFQEALQPSVWEWAWKHINLLLVPAYCSGGGCFFLPKIILYTCLCNCTFVSFSSLFWFMFRLFTPTLYSKQQTNMLANHLAKKTGQHVVGRYFLESEVPKNWARKWENIGLNFKGCREKLFHLSDDVVLFVLGVCQLFANNLNCVILQF